MDHLSLGIPHGECFGLLGQNGAGKTTTFKILTGDETMTSGSASIDGFDVIQDLAEVRKILGNLLTLSPLSVHSSLLQCGNHSQGKWSNYADMVSTCFHMK